MDKLPLICKFTYSYVYRGKMKEKPLYALLLEYSHLRNAYYANLIESNGRLHGQHYDMWLGWDENFIIETAIPMKNLPHTVLKTAKEQISIWEEVNARSSKSSSKSVFS